MTAKQIYQSLWLTVLMELGVSMPVLPKSPPLSYYIQKSSTNNDKASKR